jgi:hypothetical protein
MVPTVNARNTIQFVGYSSNKRRGGKNGGSSSRVQEISWNITPRIWVNSYQNPERICCLHFRFYAVQEHSSWGYISYALNFEQILVAVMINGDDYDKYYDDQ